MEVITAGGYNIAMIGSPGLGKSTVVKRLPMILPSPTLHEALETTKVYSIAGALKGNVSLMRNRSFHASHHTISNIALAGGGTTPRLGEVSLAYNGVLFLDGLAEFNRVALELLRQSLEDRTITTFHAKATFSHLASFMLVAAMNPCSCGYYSDSNRECICPSGTPVKYLQKLSGLLLDHIDIRIKIRPVDSDPLSDRHPSESSVMVRECIIKAGEIQLQHSVPYPGIHYNAQVIPHSIKQFACVESDAMQILQQAMIQRDLSVKAYDRTLKVAHTIAGLDGSEQVSLKHISETVNYRNLGRSFWSTVFVQPQVNTINRLSPPLVRQNNRLYEASQSIHDHSYVPRLGGADVSPRSVGGELRQTPQPSIHLGTSAQYQPECPRRESSRYGCLDHVRRIVSILRPR